ncbi:MAG: hypothetical protein IJ325_11290 [Clostridia bacterium]|nr:hypothetical protein [Clostridia bacterium]
MSIAHESDERFMILSTYYRENDIILHPGVFEYNAVKNTIEYLYDFEGEVNADYTDGSVYSFTNALNVWQFIETSENGEKSQIMRNIRKDLANQAFYEIAGSVDVRRNFSRIFYTGYDYIIWDKNNKIISIYDARNSSSGQNLNVYYPVSEFDGQVFTEANVGSMNYALMRFEELYDCSVEGQIVTVSEFPERLRMKLLAGDKDLDIIHMDHCNEGDLLSAILRYQLYLPLENEPEITKNYEAFADGVREYMTYDGHLIGIPYTFGEEGIVVTEEYLETGLPVPDAGWTIDDFWNICEASAEYCTDSIALTPEPQNWIIKAIIQNGVSDGKMNRDTVLDAVEKLYRYQKQGIIAGYRAVSSFLLDCRVTIPAQSGFYSTSELNGTVVAKPRIDGKRYAPLESFVFAYQKTDVPELAVDYLCMLSGEEFAPKIDDLKTYFMKDFDSYFTMSTDDDYSWISEKEVPMGSNAYLVKITSDVFPGTSMLTLDEPSADETIADVFKRLYADKITPEQAADEIVSYANYRYFE